MVVGVLLAWFGGSGVDRVMAQSCCCEASDFTCQDDCDTYGFLGCKYERISGDCPGTGEYVESSVSGDCSTETPGWDPIDQGG